LKRKSKMENTNSKILTLSFAIAGAISGLTLHLLIKSFSAAFGIVARLTDSDAVRHGLPVVTGLLIFAVLQFNPKVVVWGEEVVTEIRKVVWPSRKDTTAMTIVVLVMVAISSALISAFDVTSGALMKMIIGN
jgi:preprotein translocase subunit SecE